MGNSSAIEWTDATWNPVTGCSHVSDGCRFCYAETYTRRMAEVWKVPDLPWTAGNAEENVILHPERLDWPLTRRKPAAIFVNSMSDLFHELVPAGFIAEVFAVMASAQRHVFQVLTKRPERMHLLLTDPRFWFDVSDRLDRRGEHDEAHAARVAAADGAEVWIGNVWLGVSIESRKHVDRADVLRATPAAHRFISAEPLLGPLALCECGHAYGMHGARSGLCGAEACQCESARGGLDLFGIDWLIAGGESGQHYAERPERFLVRRHEVRVDRARRRAPARRVEWRPTDEARMWVRDLRDACDAAGVNFHLKQWGGIKPKSGGRELDGRTYDWTPPRPEATIPA
jgi:protein gp37